jgi:hypothetical protein
MNNWSTPNAHDGRRPGSDEASTQGRNLKREAESFVADTEHSNGGGNLSSTPKHTGGIDLEGAAELWQTPSVADVTGGHLTRGGDRSGEMLLNGQAQWVTPAARDWKGANSELHVTETGGGQNAHGPVEQSGRALFPPGPADRDAWRTIIAVRPDLAPATESSVRRVASGTTGRLDFARQDQLRSLGNLVVPLQGALGLLALLKRFE